MPWDPRDYGQQPAAGRSVAPSPMNYQPQPQPYTPVQPATHVAGTAKPRTSVVPHAEVPARWSGDTYTQQWQSALENIAADHAKFLQECQAYEKDLMPEALVDLRHAFANTEAGKLATVAAEAYQGRTDLADQKVQAVIDALAAQVDAPGSGSRPIRVRDRLQRAVDKAEPGQVATVVAKAIADASDGDLPCLIAEVPAMLKAAEVGEGFLPQVLAQRIPELAEAMEEQRRAEMSRQCIAQNAKRVQDCIRNAEPLRVPLVSPVAAPLQLDPDDASHVA